MSKQIELEKLDRFIKDSEIRLRTIATNVDSLTKEINVLLDLESQLVDNLKFLKKKNIVAIADEYKKVRENLTKTIIRLISLKNDREALKKAINSIDKAMQETRTKIKKLKEDGETNVVKGKFGRKKDG